MKNIDWAEAPAVMDGHKKESLPSENSPKPSIIKPNTTNMPFSNSKIMLSCLMCVEATNFYKGQAQTQRSSSRAAKQKKEKGRDELGAKVKRAQAGSAKRPGRHKRTGQSDIGKGAEMYCRIRRCFLGLIVANKDMLLA